MSKVRLNRNVWLNLMFLSLMPILASCSDEEDEINARLTGSWTEYNVTIVLNSDKTGYEVYDYSSWDLRSERDDFRWAADDNKLIFTYTDGDVRMYYYTITDNILTLYYDDFDLRGNYTRR